MDEQTNVNHSIPKYNVNYPTHYISRCPEVSCGLKELCKQQKWKMLLYSKITETRVLYGLMWSIQTRMRNKMFICNM